jgi:TetR/AcrR family transcriptional regulator
MSGDDRRRQLIEVAIDLFSRKGFGGTTTREIAAAAGVTEAVIFRHFATKQDLYQAILDSKCNEPGSGFNDWLVELQRFMDANDDEGLFRFMFVQIVRMDREDPQFCRLLMHASLEGNELALMHNAQLKMPVGKKFKEYIVRRQSEGAFRAMDPGVVMYAIAGIPQFYAMQKYIFANKGVPITDEQAIEGFLQILMRGLRPELFPERTKK